jgi:hypothetical protein
LTSKIINMVEKLKDAEDRFLESMFQSAPISDDGFSRRIVCRIRQKIWIRRLTLPVAMLIGGVIAVESINMSKKRDRRGRKKLIYRRRM